MTQAQKIEEKPYVVAMRDMGLTVESEFVPFSQSRNRDKKDRSLNWKVTLKRNGREVLTTDYSAGVAHCPSYSQRDNSIYAVNRINTECEKGFAVQPNSEYTINRNAPIKPESESIIAALILDSDVLNYATFEEWAPELGYDPDSRAGEKIYHECLKLALRLKRYFSDTELETLREAS